MSTGSIIMPVGANGAVSSHASSESGRRTQGAVSNRSSDFSDTFNSTNKSETSEHDVSSPQVSGEDAPSEDTVASENGQHLDAEQRGSDADKAKVDASQQSIDGSTNTVDDVTGEAPLRGNALADENGRFGLPVPAARTAIEGDTADGSASDLEKSIGADETMRGSAPGSSNAQADPDTPQLQAAILAKSTASAAVQNAEQSASRRTAPSGPNAGLKAGAGQAMPTAETSSEDALNPGISQQRGPAGNATGETDVQANAAKNPSAPSVIEEHMRRALGTQASSGERDQYDLRLSSSGSLKTEASAHALQAPLTNALTSQSYSTEATLQGAQVDLARPSDALAQAIDASDGKVGLGTDIARQSDAPITHRMFALSDARQADLTRQIALQIIQNAGDRSGSTVELQLSPEELGALKFRISLADGGVHVTVQADRPETQDLLRRNMDQLQAQFASLGFGEASVSLGDSASEQDGDGTDLGMSADLKHMHEEETPAPPILTTTHLGVDIRV